MNESVALNFVYYNSGSFIVVYSTGMLRMSAKKMLECLVKKQSN